MIEVARVTSTSTAPAARYVDKWADIENHPQWAASMEYFRLDGPFEVGATGVAKARGGTENRFEVTAYEPGVLYADTTYLDGAALTVHHEATELDGTTRLTVYAYVDGPQEKSWAARLGDAVQDGITGDVAALIALVEEEVA